MIKAIIFDLDGTILDTEKYYVKCWPLAAKHFGYNMTREDALNMRSLGRPFAPEKLKELLRDDNLEYWKIRDYRKKIMEEMLENEGIDVKKGAKILLDFLKGKNIMRAIATASPIDRTKRYLTQVGLLDEFDRLISATMVDEGKPSPDVYSYACEQLGLKPEECMAVEDSPNGVTSAYLAGCKVVMVPDQDMPDEDTKMKLYACVESLDKIIDLI